MYPDMWHNSSESDIHVLTLTEPTKNQFSRRVISLSYIASCATPI